MKGVIRQWIAYIFNIQQAFIVSYEKGGNKYLKIVKVKDRKPEELNFLVEHLLDQNMGVTEQTIEQEKEMFNKLPDV